MTPIEKNESVSMDGTLTVTGEDLTVENMHIDYAAYGVMCFVSRDGVQDA